VIHVEVRIVTPGVAHPSVVVDINVGHLWMPLGVRRDVIQFMAVLFSSRCLLHVGRCLARSVSSGWTVARDMSASESRMAATMGRLRRSAMTLRPSLRENSDKRHNRHSYQSFHNLSFGDYYIR